MAQKAVGFVSEKIKSRFQLGVLAVDFPKTIRLEHLYLEDQKKDTLLYFQSLELDVSLWDLFSRQLTVNKVALRTATAHLSRKDSTFNFDFIVRAFSSGQDSVPEKAPDEKTSVWTFRPGALQLDSVYFTLEDEVAALSMRAQLGHFEGEVKDLDLERGGIRTGILQLKNTRFSYLQKQAAKVPVDTTVSSGAFQPDVEGLNVQNVQFNFTDEAGDLKLAASVGDLELRSRKIDLNAQKIDLVSLRLKNSSAFLSSGAKNPEKSDSSVSKGGADWITQVDRLELENNSFGMDNTAEPELSSGMDYNHLLLKNISIRARDITAGAETVALRLESMSLEEKSGWQLRRFSGELRYATNGAEVRKLVLETNESQIKGDLQVNYSSLDALKNSVDSLRIDTRFDNTQVAMSDVLFFVPSLSTQAVFREQRNSRVKLKGRLKGSVNDLTISELEIRALRSTLLKLNGQIRNVMQPENMYLKLSSLSLSGTRADAEAAFPDSLLPASLQLPDSFSVNGNLTGYLKNFNAELKLRSSFGGLDLHAKMKPEAGNTEQPYAIEMTTQALDLGRLLKQESTLGPVTMRAEVKGQGRDTSNLHADLKAEISSALVKGYNYQNVQISGRLDKKCVTAVASVKDRNIDLVFDGRINTDPSSPEYVFTLDLKGADLKALHLSEEDLRVSARMESDIRDRHGKNPQGTAAVRNLLVLHNGRKYRLDSLVLRSELKENASEITLQSEIVDASLKGDLTLADLPASLMQTINSYFNLKNAAPKKQPAPQNFSFELKLKDPTLLTQNFLPQLEKLTPFAIRGEYNSSSQKIKVDGAVPQIVYSGVRLDSLKLKVDSDAEKLNAGLSANQISNTTFKLENFSTALELRDNQLAFQFNTNKDDSTRSMALGGKLRSVPEGFQLQLDRELIFNGESWKVDDANRLLFGKAGMYADRVAMSNGNRLVSVQSSELKEGAPLELRFRDFDLSTISRMIENDPKLLAGVLNGEVVLEKRNGAAAFRSNLSLRDLTFRGVAVGTVLLKADNYANPSVYLVDLKVEGNGNDLQTKGSYNVASKTSPLDLDLIINRLNLSSIEPFTFGQITRMSGVLDGRVAIKGATAKPELNGYIGFKEAAFRPKAIDSYLIIHEGRANLGSGRLTFNNLTIHDSLNNKATVNGYLGLADLQRMTFDLKVKTDNFLALNTDAKDNPVYYGRIFLDSDMDINGTMDAPKVNLKAKLNKGSYLTYVKQESLVSKSESKGIVEFTDSLYKDAIMTRTNDSIDGSSDMKGIDLHATVSFDRSVQLKMFVDPENGDSLYVVGGGTLDFTLDRSGKTSLTGRYRINDGGYFLSISDLVKRNFKIESGSYVYWSGDVLDAYVDIKAIYTIKASPIDLVQNEISAMSESERNKYRNLLTFNVYLKMTGFISAPEISFDIQLAPGDRGALNGAINSKLAQLREEETELNKQVFALLTLRRFIGENPLDNGADGGGLSSASRSSASKVLTQQLNNLSAKYVDFVDLDLGVNSFEDYSTGQAQGRTQLQVGVSRQLFNDKVSVHVGGNVELEGERAKQNNANDVAGNISIDYKLTKDGRYKLKAFRENQYENPIEGELTKTGMGIIYVRNYNKLRELLSKPDKQPQSKR